MSCDEDDEGDEVGPFAFEQADVGGGGGGGKRMREGVECVLHLRRSARCAKTENAAGKSSSSSSSKSSRRNSVPVAAAPSSPAQIAMTPPAITENFWNCNGD